MKSVSLQLEDKVFTEAEEIISQTNHTTNGYINEAVEFYNKLLKRKMLSKQLKQESLLTREESMRVLAEFENLQDD